MFQAAYSNPYGFDPAAYGPIGQVGAAHEQAMGQRGAAMSGRLASDLRSKYDALTGLGQAQLGAASQLGSVGTQEAGKNQRLGYLANMFSNLWGNMNQGQPSFGKGFGVNFGGGKYGGVV